MITQDQIDMKEKGIFPDKDPDRLKASARGSQRYPIGERGLFFSRNLAFTFNWAIK